MSHTEPLFTMYTTSWCGDCFRTKHFLKQLNLKEGIDYLEIDIDMDEKAREIAVEANDGRQSVPTLIFKDGSVLTEPSNYELGQHLKPYIVIADAHVQS